MAESGLTVIICTGVGTQMMVLDENGVTQPSKSHPGSKTDGKSDCPYAASVSAASALDASPGLEQAARYASITYRLTRARFAEVPVPSANSARGPPVLHA